MKLFSRNTFFFILALAFVAGVLVAPVVFAPAPEEVLSDPVFKREVVRYEILSTEKGSDAVVKYEYKGEKLPDKLAPNEDVTKRTETSYTRVLEPATLKKPAVYQGIFYTRPTFVKEGNEWYYIEHATTTVTAFNTARQKNPFALLFWQEAHATTATLFSGAGDGRAGESVTNIVDGCSMVTTWNQAHDFGGDDSNSTGTTALAPYVYAEYSPEPGTDPDLCSVVIYRAFVPVVTSSIPVGATISSATLNIYVTAKGNADNDGTDYITVVQTTQAAHDSLVNGDYDACGAIDNPTEGIDSGQRKDITSITISAYMTFTLNATGLGWIKKNSQSSNCGSQSGVTCLGMREGHDATDSSLDAVAGDNSITFSTSEATGTSQDPYLSVTYTGGEFAFWQFQDY